MSIKYVNWVWSLSLCSSNLKIVLFAIADYANDDGVAWPGYASLIKKTDLSKGTLAKWLRIAVEAGLLERRARSDIGKGRKANIYTIIMRDELTKSSRAELIENIKSLAKVSKRPISLCLEQRKAQRLNSKSSTLVHEPIIEPSVKQPPIDQEGEVEGLNEEAWQKYLSYVEERGFESRMKVGLEEVKLQLMSFGDHKMQQYCVDKTIEMGWMGLYPLPKNINEQQVGQIRGQEIPTLEQTQRWEQDAFEQQQRYAAQASATED